MPCSAARVLDEGVTPTTAHIHLIRYGATSSTDVLGSGIRSVTAPVDFLKNLHIVDTPGTNAIIREHERLTTEFVPRADFILFVTSADRPSPRRNAPLSKRSAPGARKS